MLHVAYLFVPLGLAATGAAALGLVPKAAGLHLLGIGAIGGMTVAVMMRAARGHTGRTLEAGGWLTAAFVLIVAAAIVRGLSVAGIDGITVAAMLWTAAFAVFSVRMAPWLAAPSVARRRVTRPATQS